MQEPNLSNFGGLESPKDDRDFLGSGQASISHPSIYLPDNSKLPVYNQLTGTGGQTACGGVSGTKLQNILLGFQGDLSWRFVFALTTKITGLSPEQGTYGRAIMQVLQKYGVCRAELFPNDTSFSLKDFADWTKIPQAAYIDALSRRIGPYAITPLISFDTICQAIYDYRAVLILKSPWTPASWWPYPSNSGHFFIGEGYNKSQIRFANSFGSNWHQEGNGYLEKGDVESIKEVWTVIEAPFSYVFNLNLSYGDVGYEVNQLQQALQYLKIMPSGVFGPFGPSTKKALATFQAIHSIKDDGTNFGPQSRAALNQALN